MFGRSNAHPLRVLDELRELRRRVMSRNVPGLVTEQRLPIFERHAGSAQALTECVPKIVAFFVSHSGKIKTLVSSSGTLTSQSHRSSTTSRSVHPVFTLKNAMRCRCPGSH